MDTRRRQREPISASSFVRMIIVTSLSTSFLVWIRIRKICRPSMISSHAGLIQTAPLRIDYMLCGKEVYFRDVESLVLLTKTNLGYVSQRLMLLLGGSDLESKRFWAWEPVSATKCYISWQPHRREFQCQLLSCSPNLTWSSLKSVSTLPVANLKLGPGHTHCAKNHVAAYFVKNQEMCLPRLFLVYILSFPYF